MRLIALVSIITAPLFFSCQAPASKASLQAGQVPRAPALDLNEAMLGANPDAQAALAAIDKKRGVGSHFTKELGSYAADLAVGTSAGGQADDIRHLGTEINDLCSQVEAAILDGRYGQAILFLGKIDEKADYANGRLRAALRDNGGDKLEPVRQDLKSSSETLTAQVAIARAAVRRLSGLT